MTETLELQLETLANENAFLQKYFSLRKKCEQLQQANEKIVNRIQHVKKLIKRYKRERRFLSSRLDEHGDQYKDAQIPVMWEEDQVYNLLRPTPVVKNSDGKSLAPLAKKSTERSVASIMSSISPILLAHGMSESGGQSSPSSGKGKKIKSEKEKDASAPKKPANAFLMFCQKQRAAVQEEYFKENQEEISNHELTKRIAQQWNSLELDQKKIYYDMYEQEKERYDREVRQYHDREGSSQSEANMNREHEANVAAMGLEAQSAVDALMMDN